MRIATYNVNGLRAAIKKGLLDWLKIKDFDIVCLQEIKSQYDQVDSVVFHEIGYKDYWHPAEKKGYSGVLTLTRREPDKVIAGMNSSKYDLEGRILRTDFDDWTLLNCYYPSGSSSEDRHAFKMQFLKAFKPWINKLLKERPNLIVVGDYNIVHQDMDIHNPGRKDNPSGFRPEERKWLNNWFKKDFTDAFRQVHPDSREYSWWTYRAGARGKDKGWRIDYISVSNPLVPRIIGAGHHKEAEHSDHCAVWMEIDLD